MLKISILYALYSINIDIWSLIIFMISANTYLFPIAMNAYRSLIDETEQFFDYFVK